MAQNINEFSHSQLVDRAAIHDVMCRWCRAIDRLDFDGIRSVFHPDAIDNHGAYSGGVDGLVEWIKERHRTIPFSMHMLGNMLIEFSGSDEALVETYVLAIQRYPSEARASLVNIAGDIGESEGACDLFLACRYIDRFTRREKKWRIQERTVTFDSVMAIDAPSSGSPSGPQWENGRRDANDVIFRQLAGVGLA